MANNQHVRDIMTPDPATVSEKDTVRDAARIMADQDTGVVPVVDDGRRIVGLVTDRDIVVRLVAEGRDVANASVGDVMSKSVRSVKEDTPLQEAMELMSRAKVRRVPVVNDNDQLIGIASVGDVAADTNERNKVGSTIQDISKAPANN